MRKKRVPEGIKKERFLRSIFGRGVTLCRTTGRYSVLDVRYISATTITCGGVKYEGVLNGDLDRIKEAVECLMPDLL